MEYPKFKVTVSCMTYNQAKYITDALNGFTMQQTSFPFICTIVDDASTDGEQEVIRRYVEEYFDFSEGSVAYHKETDYAYITYAQHKTNKNCYFAVLYLKENLYLQPQKKDACLKEWRDGIEYKFFEWSVLTIGGAYSIDKDYRLSKRHSDGWCGWFKDEQLYDWERAEITDRISGNHYNIVLTHTCPISFEPTDLFLSFIDQSTVDKTMENWLEELKTKIIWDKWLFGHYHTDRQIGPDVQMFYKGIIDLEDIMKGENIQ